MAVLIPILATSCLLGATLLTFAQDPTVSTQTVFTTMCDASAAVALNDDLFAVGNDEDNVIRVYSSSRGGSPVRSYDISVFLKVGSSKPETDLEAACKLGDQIFWTSSHGRNRTGKFRANRHFFFATRWEQTSGGGQMRAVGKPYRYLLNDLLREPRLFRFRLDQASRLPPKAPGALNIEGLCPTPEGHLLIGFRNPIPDGLALLVPLLNPNELLEGKRARFGPPIQLDLEGRGIRDIALWQGKYLIVAGSFDAKGSSRLYTWQGTNSPAERVHHLSFKELNPEAIVVYPDGRWPFQLLSDDGTVLVNGVCCKQLPIATQRSYRSVWVTIPKP